MSLTTAVATLQKRSHFGLRRGVDKDGKGYYYALDVTSPTAPKYLWRIYKGKEGTFNDLGQTWSTPVICESALRQPE